MYMTGEIVFYLALDGYGFAKGEDGIDYFVHRSEVQGPRKPKAGDAITFEPGTRRGKPQAKTVRLEAGANGGAA
jgi:cold shock CspA family protein